MVVTPVAPPGGRQSSLVEQLEHALDTLGKALTQAISEVDIKRIGDISDAIGRAAGALQIVQQLK
jgi:hypothetical protein